MRLPRWYHRLYAWLNGYFWLPCPLCGEMFGGHEWDSTSIDDERKPAVFELRCGDRVAWAEGWTCDGEGVCPTCSPRAVMINAGRGRT